MLRQRSDWRSQAVWRSSAMARGARVVDDKELVAGRREIGQAADDDRRAGAGLLDLLAAVVEQAADAAVAGAGEDHVADASACRPARARSRPGPRPGSIRASMTVPRAGARRVGLEVHDLALKVEDFDELRDALAGDGAGADDFGVAAPLDRVEALRGELAEDHVRVGVGAVDLVQRHDDRHLGRRGRG